MKNEICPPKSELSAFVRCQVSEAQAESISEHISSCPQCEETVVGLEKGADTYFEKLKPCPAPFPFQDEPELERMAEAAKQRSPAQTENSSAEPLASGMPEYLRDYQIIEKIGEGGMGAVYKAVHQRLKKTVALKILATNRIGDEPAVARFEREMSVIGQLNHPHIVQALDAGEHDGKHYLVMEYVEGRDLSDLVKRCSPLSIRDACQLIFQAAIGLQCAHEHGFVHRDIKPSNLMLAATSPRADRSDAIVKILDLGLARALDQSAGAVTAKVDLTTTGQVMGTLDYMAPEQGGDAHQVDIRADIYSLGATLYKLLTGDSPYAEHAHKSPLQRLMAIAQHEPPAIQSKRVDVPNKLAAIVHRMMAKKPEDRFATPADVAAALEPFCVGADLAALLAPEGSTHKSVRRPQSARTQSRAATGDGVLRRWKTALAGLGGILTLAAILLITTRNGTVEVSSPEGKLPDDVQVVVSHGGQEVEVLQADNQWSAKIVHGEYHVQLRGGEDRFEVKNATLTVTRLGRVVVTVNLRKPDANAANQIAATSPTAKPQEKTPRDRTEAKPAAAPDWSLVAPSPAEVILDQEKPFVIFHPKTQAVSEYKFITEVLPILKSDEILEVRGNGPFKMPQVVRDKADLHLRAGNGYRPRFIADIEIPDGRDTHWFTLNDVKFTAEGCDFLGIPAESLVFFVGSGDWVFQSCRLIGRTAHTGRLVGFSGRKLVIRDSLLSCPSAYSSMGIGPKVQVEFSNNIVLNSSPAFDLQLGGGQAITLNSNLFFRTQLFALFHQQGDEPLQVVAERNLFVTPSAAICGATHNMSVAKLLRWKGDSNRVTQFQVGPLFASFPGSDKPKDKEIVERLPESVEDWNRYWNNAGDLELTPGRPFEWDHFANNDWTAGARRIGDEIASSRKRFPSLPNVGPDIEQVGAQNTPAQAGDTKVENPNDDRPAALEGGPFVILRNGEAVAGFTSIASALEMTKTGDVIELRSDGVFRTGQVAAPRDQRLTLRAAKGYSSAFAQFWLNGGDWTLEGLRFQPETVTDSLACSARRVANCTVEANRVRTPFQLLAPEGSDEPTVVLNCYMAQGLFFDGPGISVRNSIVRSLAFKRATTFTANNTCFWNHPNPIQPIACISQLGTGKVDIHLSDCMIDTDLILEGQQTNWIGERNLFRVYGRNWGAFTILGQPPRAYRTLAEWRTVWKSDADSQYDESPLLRPELWRWQ